MEHANNIKVSAPKVQSVTKIDAPKSFLQAEFVAWQRFARMKFAERGIYARKDTFAPIKDVEQGVMILQFQDPVKKEKFAATEQDASETYAPPH